MYAKKAVKYLLWIPSMLRNGQINLGDDYVDYSSPFQGKIFLVLVDPLLKWMEIYPVSTSTSKAATEMLRICFDMHECLKGS